MPQQYLPETAADPLPDWLQQGEKAMTDQPIEREIHLPSIKRKALAVITIAFLALVGVWCAAHAQTPCTTTSTTACFTASKTTGEFPIATTLTWAVPGAATCTAGNTPGWIGSVPVKGTKSLTGINIDMQLTLNCKAADGNGSMLLTWTPATANTNGTPLTNLAGHRIQYSVVGSAGPTFDRQQDVLVPGANAYRLENLTPGDWASRVITLVTSDDPTLPFRVSGPSNVATKTIAGTPGAVFPQLSVAIDGYTLPLPPTNVTATDPTAFEIRPSSTGALLATRIGLVPVDTKCDATQTRVVGTVTFYRVPRESLDAINWPANVKLQDVWARCT